MLRDDEASSALFLANWELELRAGFTPEEELDAINRLNEDYLYPDEPPDREATLIAEVTAAVGPLLRRAREEEATWSDITMNDRLTAAFAALGRKEILAQERCGTTIEDGWGYVGLSSTPKHRGAVFYHQEDVFDAVEGRSLLVAFGGCGRRPSSPDEDTAIAEQALAVFAQFGIPAAWSGRAEDRIEIAPFSWRRRRWTSPPLPVDGAPVPWTRTVPQLELFPVADDACRTYEQALIARRTTYAFDRRLSTVMRAAWAFLGGNRGQAGSTGDPLVFVRAGEPTAVAPRDATKNLAPEMSAVIRGRAIDVRRAQRPWWKVWA